MNTLKLVPFITTLLVFVSNCLPLVSAAPPINSEVAKAMDEFVAQKQIAGAITVVAGAKDIKHWHVTGLADIEAKQPLNDDSLFWIASMSKPVAGACLMMLVDEGKVALQDPVSKYLPEMAELKSTGGTKVTVTLQHLMTHTSGMSEIPAPNTYKDKTLAEAAARYAQLPVMFAPGSQWKYSQTGINTAARVIEVVSGMTYDRFVEERLCKPLQMKDTTFYLSESQLKRLAKSYRRTDQGTLESADIMLLAGKSPTDRERLPAANGGLFSTAHDYLRFCQMLLNEGSLDGVRILSPESVVTMRTVLTGDLVPGFTPGNGWGVGVCVVKDPQGVTKPLSAGTFGHGGAYGTQAWIDPVRGEIYLLLVQRSNFGNSDGSDVRRKFHELTR